MKFPVLFLIAIALASCTDVITEISISTLANSIVLNEVVSFKTNEDIPELFSLHWDFGDGSTSEGSVVDHEYFEAGIYHVKLYQEKGGEKILESSAIVRVHNAKTLGLPQVLLDTDARNEIGQFLRADILSLMDLWGEDTKSLYDLTTISAVISNHLQLSWLTEIEDMGISNENNYEWLTLKGESDVHIVREINYEAMKEDFFSTINGNPTKLIK